MNSLVKDVPIPKAAGIHINHWPNLRHNSLTFEANFITVQFQFKDLVHVERVGIKDSLGVDIDPDTLVHFLGCWGEIKRIAGVLSESCPSFGTSCIPCEFLSFEFTKAPRAH